MVEIFLYRVIEVRLYRLLDFLFPFLGFFKSPFLELFFDVHILKGTPGLFSNPEVKLERVYRVVTWETSGEMYMTSNFPPLEDTSILVAVWQLCSFSALFSVAYALIHSCCQFGNLVVFSALFSVA